MVPNAFLTKLNFIYSFILWCGARPKWVQTTYAPESRLVSISNASLVSEINLLCFYFGAIDLWQIESYASAYKIHWRDESISIERVLCTAYLIYIYIIFAPVMFLLLLELSVFLPFMFNFIVTFRNMNTTTVIIVGLYNYATALKDFCSITGILFRLQAP